MCKFDYSAAQVQSTFFFCVSQDTVALCLMECVHLTRATMNHKQSELIERYQDSKLDKGETSEDEEELLNLLEDDEDETFSKYRETRMQQLSSELKHIEKLATSDSHAGENLGRLIKLSNEKELIDAISSNAHFNSQDASPVVVHFQQPNFAKCKIMNERLAIMAEKHLGVRFYNINAADAPFFVARLQIKVLPFVIGYIQNGLEAMRLVGFEKLGNDPNTFNVEALEHLLYMHGLIKRRTINYGSIRQTTAPVQQTPDDDDLDI